jgi:phospholipid transport system substrate-binding protein
MTSPLFMPLPASLLAAGLLLSAAAQAQPQPPYGIGPQGSGPPAPEAIGPRRPASGAQSSPARQAAATVSAGLQKLFDFVRSSDTPQNKLQTAAFLDREIAPYFDFDYMARFVAGADWQRLTAEQRKALAAQLESRILSGLTQRLIGYGGQQVRFVRPRTTRGGVDVQVGLSTMGGGYPTRLVFRLYQTDDDWRVYDVLAEGRSLLAFYRSAFEQLLQASS